MGASVFVGRVGGLAIALGIGAAVGGLGTGVAGASPTDSAGSSSKNEQPAMPRDRASTPGSQFRAGRPTAAQASPASESSRLTATGDADHRMPAPQHDSDTPLSTIRAKTAMRTIGDATDVAYGHLVAPSASAVAPAAAEMAPASDVVPTTPEADVEPPVIARAAPAVGTAETVVGDITGSLPASPVESAASWVMAAAARRDSSTRPAIRGTRVVSTSAGRPSDAKTVPAAAAVGVDVVGTLTPAAAVTSVDPITAIFQQFQAVISGIVGAITSVFNQIFTFLGNVFNPTIPVRNASPLFATPTVGLPDLTTGVITGQLSATDTDGDPLVFGGPTTTAKGTVTVDAGTGAFTYTPSAAARHNASGLNATAADKADTLNLTVSDGKATTTVAVNVGVRSMNSDPLVTVRSDVPNTAAGTITGAILGSDADGDTLTYSTSAAAGGGRVVIDSKTGAFTYTSVARVDTVTAVIKGFKSPVDIAFSPDGSRAYVSNEGGNTVSVVDTGTKTIVATISGFDHPTALAITPDGSRLYVAGKTGVSVVNAATNRIAGNVSGLYAAEGEAPSVLDVAISPTANIAYVVNDGTALSVVDIATDTVIKTIDVTLWRNTSVAFSPDGSRAYVGSWSLSAIDTTTHRKVFPGFKWDVMEADALAVSPQGDRIYTANHFGEFQVGDADLNVITSVDPPAYLADGIAVSRDGGTVYALASTGEIYLFDTATSSFVGTAKYACGACSSNGWSFNTDQKISVSPDGTSVYVADGSGVVKVLTRPAIAAPDSFTVTVADGHGGSTAIPVTVSFR